MAPQTHDICGWNFPPTTPLIRSLPTILLQIGLQVSLVFDHRCSAGPGSAAMTSGAARHSKVALVTMSVQNSAKLFA